MKSRKHFVDSLEALLAWGEPADPRQAERHRWLHRTTAAWLDALKRSTAAWDRMMAEIPDDLSDEEFEALPQPPEEAEVNALWKQLDDVIQHDRWPKEFYSGGI